MFDIEDSLRIISVDIDYLQFLYNIDHEVQFSASGYDNKKFIGILVNQEGVNYVIPLSSAKEKHKSLKNFGETYVLIHEFVDLSDMKPNDIWVPVLDKGKVSDLVKHILCIVDCRKMIPVKEDVFQTVNIHHEDNDPDDVKKYKDLLEKEYSFCVTYKGKILARANKVYTKQINSGKVRPKCCNYKLLENNYKSFIKPNANPATDNFNNSEYDKQ